MEYLNEEKEGYYHEEGRINLLEGGRIEYTLKDHLGNGRVYCYHDTPLNQAKTIQEAHYYPFGLPIQKLSPNFEASVGVEANNYQYNGIELVEDFGLHVNHALFRTLDPQTGRWWQIDPLVEEFYAWSPYNSNLDNPIWYNDPKGDCPLCPVAPILIGAAVGFIADLSFQVGANIYEGGVENAFSDIKVNSLIASTSAGALGGFAVMNIATLGVATSEAITLGVAANTGIGMVESTSKQILSTNTVDGSKVVRDGIISGGTAGYGDSAGYLFKEFTSESAEKVLPSISINGASEIMENTFQNMGDSYGAQNKSTNLNNNLRSNKGTKENNTTQKVTPSPYKNQDRNVPQMLENMPIQ
ncbi:MAG: hypothetical protein IPM47_20380 [Sphingobacteriales bacterium]|nr:MAG: hypothetical protein IPM47_20380 [Sphingobacteriales bacterium]